MPVFETPRLTVRQFSLADADSFFLFNSDPEVMRYIRPVKGRAASDTFLKENLVLYNNASFLGRWLVEEKLTGRFVGCFSILYLDTADEGYHVGYALMPSEWGKGYATELVAAGLQYFFAQTSKPFAFAITEPRNSASQKVLTRSGFTFRNTITLDNKTLDLFHISREEHGRIVKNTEARS